ncbi:C3a anaphylatoxin chemotactic receptor-like [Carassius gibelio]|uniref:C3a anaphylatoxin chemotactic receptor-like n=1 Tax=Carassius gibelio TaxID=101364 RepID=UPI002278229A|nr:C3a anaphylatoxin chemotactic receptor-like [Carassius gibelio]XP_052463603.1 C3a anaphylatoxin chemotactic receptor-like [Carassius gibelio]XP_052463604.1 C3a anaphylatoxin chemotactic receptor-like [Carassius gibelio]
MEDYYDILEYPMRVISLVFFYLTLILGVPGNAFVVYVAGLKMKRTVNTVGFLNLATADLLCCLLTLYYVIGSKFDDYWPYGSTSCKIFHFVLLITMFASVFTLNLISLDRFTLVITPVWAQNHRSLFIARLSCAAAWILALIISLPFMMSREIYTENNETYCVHYQADEEHSERRYRRLSIIRFVFGFLVPLMCITTCYGFIARKLGRRHFHSGRAFRVMLAVIVAFFLCWLPYHIVDLIIIYGDQASSLVGYAVDPLAVSLAYFNSCLNPIMYAFMGQDFKSNVKLSLRRVFERAFSEEGTQMTQTTQSQSQQTHSL